MVEFVDGTVLAQLGVTDMRLPIQYALSHPERWDAAIPGMDWGKAMRLDFDVPDRERFPCLALAYEALEKGGSVPATLNAANEEAVSAFLDGPRPVHRDPRHHPRGDRRAARGRHRHPGGRARSRRPGAPRERARPSAAARASPSARIDHPTTVGTKWKS